MARPLRILVLYWHDGPPETIRPAIRKHLAALEGQSACELLYFNVDDGAPPSWMRHASFDAVVFHTLALTCRWHHNFAARRPQFEWLARLRCPKVALPQDEYDDSEVLDEWLAELGVDVIFTNFDSSTRAVLYPRMHRVAEFHECLTGYVDDEAAARFAQAPPIASRGVDLVYRAAHLPYWFGRQGQLKYEVGEVVRTAAERRMLACDISTRREDTIVGPDWFDFLASGRAAVGCESGSTCLDRRGEIKHAVQAMLADEPSLSFEETGRRLPVGWDDYAFVAISPRHFEAAVTGTAQVLVEGRYSGVLEPEVHYLPLRRDFSNLDEVLDRVRDHGLLQRLADRAHADLIGSGRYSYAGFAARLRAVIEARAGTRALLQVPLGVTRALAGRHCRLRVGQDPSPERGGAPAAFV